MILFDLHNHSNHSRDAKDSCEDIVKNAIASQLDCIGITDHNYWITGHFDEELSELFLLREKYKNEIKVLCGMEVSFLHPDGIDPASLAGYDYCLLEYFIDAGVPFEQVCEFASKFPCRVGLAHVDIFSYAEGREEQILSMMAKHNIFWEMNVNYDTIHGHREHKYCKDFMTSPYQQEMIKKYGIQLSVGFDTHDLSDYDADRVKNMCRFISENNFPIPEFCTT